MNNKKKFGPKGWTPERIGSLKEVSKKLWEISEKATGFQWNL